MSVATALAFAELLRRYRLLLSGTTPLDRVRLKKAAFTEMLRIIREEESPSARLINI